MSRVAVRQCPCDRVNGAVKKCDELARCEITAQHAVELCGDFRWSHILRSEPLHHGLNIGHKKRGCNPFAHNVGHAYGHSGLTELDYVKIVASHNSRGLIASNDFEIR